MSFDFKIIEKENILNILPLVEKLNDFKISKEVLKERILEMTEQNYECAGVFFKGELVGICGLWYCTRHYSGKSTEVDHVFIEEKFRGQGIGKQFFKWIYNYLKTKGFEAIELNTYTTNYASHKFYYNEGFKILGYHFLKKL
ncbi:GNAT family N-acetyltransferase [Neotamlana laminarinivorans]|uniref:GNAT family N-acetyltransferase n=1 Tax=Neotamlana laminarinivorans TaxID=2883124 RepID=A0A9X1I1C8_9FLAO|nr:GNAT family N-acetyltransferase [Tamlana laminarinivorans]MCB4799636.1 GNAT family N-acetyltransferase [Tamlana laminarinivorans]